MARKICVVTGTRAEYGLLKPVIDAILLHPKLALQLVVAGMHLEERFGLTIKEIEQDGIKIDGKVKLCPEIDSGLETAKSIGVGIKDFAEVYDKLRPDIVLVLGDRFEPLAAAIAAAFMRIPVAHIHGGDRTKGGLDEPTRHSISKFASIHFPVTKNSAERLIKMGEAPENIFVSGAPGLDSIINSPIPSKDSLEKYLGFKLKKPTILFVQHSISTRPELSRKQITESLQAIVDLKYETILICPNSDSGNKAIFEEIEKFKKHKFIHILKSMKHEYYLSLMKNADVMVGNSSSGIIEAPSFKLPVVNIGWRQEDRERAINIIDCVHKKEEIISSIKKALSEEFKESLKDCVNPYGNGTAGKLVAKNLSEIMLSKELIEKKITY